MKGSKGQKGGPFAGLERLKRELLDKQEQAPSAASKQGGAAASARPKSPRERAKAEPSSRETSPDERALFAQMLASVTPLAEGKSRLPVRAPKGEGEGTRAEVLRMLEVRAREEAEVMQRLRALADGSTRFEVVDDGKRVEGRLTELSHETLRRLRQGLFPIDARLDLHGLTLDVARDRVDEFLRHSRARGERCVLVIHGKGERGPGRGVLRGEIAAWLSQDAPSESVAAFTTAHNEDGGEGAVYVLLRR